MIASDYGFYQWLFGGAVLVITAPVVAVMVAVVWYLSKQSKRKTRGFEVKLKTGETPEEKPRSG